jgi:hypothetical protein
MLVVQQTVYSCEGSINKLLVDDKGLVVLCVFGTIHRIRPYILCTRIGIIIIKVVLRFPNSVRTATAVPYGRGAACRDGRASAGGAHQLHRPGHQLFRGRRIGYVLNQFDTSKASNAFIYSFCCVHESSSRLSTPRRGVLRRGWLPRAPRVHGMCAAAPSDAQVIGEMVNLSARLMTSAGQGEVLVDQATKQQTELRIVYEVRRRFQAASIYK